MEPNWQPSTEGSPDPSFLAVPDGDTPYQTSSLAEGRTVPSDLVAGLLFVLPILAAHLHCPLALLAPQ